MGEYKGEGVYCDNFAESRLGALACSAAQPRVARAVWAGEGVAPETGFFIVFSQLYLIKAP